jgi:hypothetical protein
MSGHITLVAARNDALDTMGAYQWLSLHTLYSTTGANEVSGGTYLRQQITFDVAIDAAKTSLLPITFAALPLGDPIYRPLLQSRPPVRSRSASSILLG